MSQKVLITYIWYILKWLHIFIFDARNQYFILQLFFFYEPITSYVRVVVKRALYD